ncbi:SUMF1/EgtB/PvdO family nonheme iron enzyme [candidate division KSB1 bacterium]|nr:SUMF1/EgtB/PvdO family nonheme iron enzyme [candidate division KSB1 bacterium]
MDKTTTEYCLNKKGVESEQSVVRGGSWNNNNENNFRCSNRNNNQPDNRNNNIGFRVVRSPQLCSTRTKL